MEPIGSIGNTVSPFPSQPTTTKKKNPLIIIIIVILLILVGGLFIWRQSKKSNQPQVSGVVSNQEATPTEKPKIDKLTVKIQVLNGTGTPGQASSAVDALKKAGYSADNIKSGNAATYDHTTTTIDTKTGFEDIASDIKTALSSLFDNIGINSSPLGSDSQYDIVITTGGKIYETPTPTNTPTPTSTPSATITPP